MKDTVSLLTGEPPSTKGYEQGLDREIAFGTACPKTTRKCGDCTTPCGARHLCSLGLACYEPSSQTSARRVAIRAAVGLLTALLTLTRCTESTGPGPTAPTGPFRLTVLQAFGTSSSPYYNGVTYQSYAYDIDPAGQVVGMAERADARDTYGAALWPVDGKPPVSLEANGYVLQAAYGTNGRGQVVGVGRCGGLGNACLWEAGQLKNLGWLDYAIYDGSSQPLAINDSGVAVGWADAAPHGFDHAVMWRNGVATDIGTLGGLQSEAIDIDNEGRVIGWSRTVRSDGSFPLARHAFLWQSGVMTDLSHDLSFDLETIPYAINDSGQVAGRIGDIGSFRAVLWDKGSMTMLPGAEPSQAFGVNNRGDVVGTYTPSGTTFHAALWRDGVRYDLNDLVADPKLGLHWANAINDAGQIVGFGIWKSDGREVAFLLTPNGTR